MSNHVNRFYAAASVLAGHGYIKQRLVKAYEENLAAIEDEELPIIVKQSFADLRHIMSRVAPVKTEGPIRASVRKMSVEEVDDCAHKIIDLYTDMIRYRDNAREPMDSATSSAPASCGGRRSDRSASSTGTSSTGERIGSTSPAASRTARRCRDRSSGTSRPASCSSAWDMPSDSAIH